MAALAKQAARSAFESIEFWFRRRYNLTRHDERFLAATRQEMLEDFWMHTYFDDPKAVTETVEDDDFDEASVAQQLRNFRPGAAAPLGDDFEDLTP